MKKKFDWKNYYPSGRDSFDGAFIRSGGDHQKWLEEVKKFAPPWRPVEVGDIEPMPGHYEYWDDGYGHVTEIWVPEPGLSGAANAYVYVKRIDGK